MAETLRIFVSATKDLEAQRAIVGQTLAHLPVQVGAEIRRTPATGTSYENMFELVSNVDRVYFLFGRDITAPSGAEWALALQLERSILPLRLAGPITPAAQEFLRFAPMTWVLFHNQQHLNQLIGLDLIDILLHPKNRYGLTTPELEALTIRRRQIEKGIVATIQEPGGAEGGGIILDRGRIESEEGVLIEE